MQRVYSNQFIITKGGVEGRKLLGLVVSDCKGWIADSVKRQTGDDLPMTGWDKGVTTSKGCSVQLVTRDSKDTLWAEVTYDHPAPEDPERRWRTRMRIGFYKGVLEFQLDIFTGYKTTVLRPPVKDGGQPRLVRILAANYTCIRAGVTLKEKANRVSVGTVPSLVADISRRDRRLPLIVLAPDARRRYAIMPDKLQSRLLGIAEVVFLRDEHATADLNKAAGEALHVYDGAFRIYWPGAKPSDHPFANPLYTPMRLSREGVTQEADVEQYICRILYGVAVMMNVDSAVIDGALQAAEAERRIAALNLDTVKGLKEALSAQLDANKGLEIALQERNDRINYLEAELSRSQRKGAPTEERVDYAEAVKQVKTAGDVVELADQAFDRLIIHSRAVKNSEGYKSRHLDDLWLVMDVLNEVAGRYDEKGSLGQTFADACKEVAASRGKKLPKFAISDSETNLSQFGDERMVNFEGTDIQLEQHFTLGKADPEGCIHVFIEPLPKRREILVGYVGPHLSYSSA